MRHQSESLTDAGAPSDQLPSSDLKPISSSTDATSPLVSRVRGKNLRKRPAQKRCIDDEEEEADQLAPSNLKPTSFSTDAISPSVSRVKGRSAGKRLARCADEEETPSSDVRKRFVNYWHWQFLFCAQNNMHEWCANWQHVSICIFDMPSFILWICTSTLSSVPRNRNKVASCFWSANIWSLIDHSAVFRWSDGWVGWNRWWNHFRDVIWIAYLTGIQNVEHLLWILLIRTSEANCLQRMEPGMVHPQQSEHTSGTIRSKESHAATLQVRMRAVVVWTPLATFGNMVAGNITMFPSTRTAPLWD